MNILDQLQNKATGQGVRMPSIKAISKLLTSFGIDHKFQETYNTVERRSKGRRYVNSRHRGKDGFSLEISEIGLYMDSSDSYYSWNTESYAAKLINLLKQKGKIE